MVALADRWPGYPTETVDVRRLATEVDATVPGGVTPELVEGAVGWEDDF